MQILTSCFLGCWTIEIIRSVFVFLWHCKWFYEVLETSVINKYCWFGFTWGFCRIQATKAVKKTYVFHLKSVVHNMYFFRREIAHSGTFLTFLWLLQFYSFLRKKESLIYSNFLHSLLFEYYFVIPSCSIFLFPSFCHRLFRTCNGRSWWWENMYMHVCLCCCTWPFKFFCFIFVCLFCFFLPLQPTLASCLCYYSRFRTGSHLSFCWRMTDQQQCVFCWCFLFPLMTAPLSQSSWIWPWLCISMLCSSSCPANL